MKVFLTVDTEVWNFYQNFEKNLQSAIYGSVGDTKFGLEYLLELFKYFDLETNFFVEPLFTTVAGNTPLEEIIALIRDYDQDVQLHLHTEWLHRCESSILKSNAVGPNMHDFSLEDQTELIRYGIEKLAMCGAGNVNAFRAGNYGGNFDTLEALSLNNITYDTTHNTCYLNRVCKMKTPKPLLQPKLINGVYEFPISFFCDWPNHFRHMQITACSTYELRNALWEAWHNGWHSVVIVIHTFEAIKRVYKKSGNYHVVDRIVLRRLEDLSRFLSKNRDKFETIKFSRLNKNEIPEPDVTKPLKSRYILTIHRHGQQLYRRLFYR